jgi:modulator of FtsH protease
MFYATEQNSPSRHNPVLRNAFGLLALSMIPTAVGAAFAMSLGIPAMMMSSPLIASLVFLAVMFGMLFMISANSDSALGVIFMLLFTFLAGMWLSGILSVALAMTNGWQMIMTAALGTAGVVTGCSIYAMNTKRDFSSMGGFLFGSVIALIVVSLANIFFQMPLLSILISIAAIVIFSLFMVFDVQRVVRGGETNYVMAATSIYLNIYNIFSSLLNLLLSFGGGSSD